MKVALDLTWLPQRRAGAGRYAYELVDALAGLDEPDHTFSIYAPQDALSGNRAKRDSRFWIEPGVPRGRVGRLLWEQIQLPRKMLTSKPDVLHVGHSQAPLVTSGVPLVVTFHDATYELLPERYPASRRLYYQAAARMAVRKAKLIIAVSHCVSEDLQRCLKVPADRIRVVPEAAGAQFQPAPARDVERVRQRYGLSEPFVLSVGSLEPGKGRAALSEAVRRLEGRAQLAIAGQSSWGSADNGAHYLGYVPDEDLAALYSAAAVFAFPSHYEGFGLPVLEAMACGVPVVASNTSAIPEVAGSAAILVQPTAPELAEALRSVLDDPVLRATMVEQGKRRAALFSWEETARRTLEVYREAASL
jgi:glycosyltransferase involved in cell wall biosynthesis